MYYTLCKKLSKSAQLKSLYFITAFSLVYLSKNPIKSVHAVRVIRVL